MLPISFAVLGWWWCRYSGGRKQGAWELLSKMAEYQMTREQKKKVIFYHYECGETYALATPWLGALDEIVSLGMEGTGRTYCSTWNLELFTSKTTAQPPPVPVPASIRANVDSSATSHTPSRCSYELPIHAQRSWDAGNSVCCNDNTRMSIFLTIRQGFLHSLLPPVPVPNEVAVVQPCSTGGKDETSEVTTYTETRVSVVIDLRTMECVIGSVKRGGNEWGIVDRSSDFARTVFVDPEIDHD
ncbi:hypothetical protein JB92DRAFT_3096276 [Gautieria morchelliformis]|nr:hypothetical protein JB92DRAFT_3096276 [Gautieria morchelliformis]